MKLALKTAACALLVAVAAACGGEKSGDGLTPDQRERLNQIAENTSLGEPEVVDTSADSLVVNDAMTATDSGEPAPSNAAAPANAVSDNRQ